MLKSLTVKNFRAFREAVTIDFAKFGNYTFNPECVENGIVKTAIVYGKNSNGKSSIALAIFDIVANLTDNFANRTIYLNYQNAFSLDQPVEFKFQFQYSSPEVSLTQFSLHYNMQNSLIFDVNQFEYME